MVSHAVQPRGLLARAGLLAAHLWLAAAPALALAGEARCWIDKGALVASASFGDIAGDFVIDLSAPVSQLHVTRAQMDGLDGPAATRTLILAGQRTAGFTMAIDDLDARTGHFDTVINGVIGVDLLRRFTVEIAPSPCRLRLFRTRAPRLARRVRLPLLDPGGAPRVPALVTDGTRVRTDALAIDTAHWISRIDGARLSRPPATPPAPPAFAGEAGAPPIRLRALELAGRLFEQVPADIAGPDTPEAIGMAIWSNFRLRLDIQSGWLDLAPAR